MTKFLDSNGVKHLWSKVKAADAATLTSAKSYTDTKFESIDNTLFVIVTTLPTSGIDKNKIYIIADNETNQNKYTEYIYTGDTSAAYDDTKWEKLGDFQADVDLKNYVNKTYADGSYAVDISAINGADSIILALSSEDTTNLGSTVITSATNSTAGVMSAADKENLDSAVSKLSGIASGAEVNQNAFSNITIGTTTIAADSKTDTLTLAAGSNVTLTPDATNDKITISATNTVYTHPAGNAPTKSLGLYKFETDATSHIKSVTAVQKSDITALGIPAQDTTYGVATETSNGLMSAADKVIVNTLNENLITNGKAETLPSEIYSDLDIFKDTEKVVLEFEVNKQSTSDGYQPETVERTLPAATTTTAGVMSASDKEKVDKIDIIEGKIPYDIDYFRTSQFMSLALKQKNGDTTSDVELELATADYAGIMSAADKDKLDDIAPGATADSALTTAEIDALCV